MAVTITRAVVAVIHGGGVGEIIDNFPVQEGASFVSGNNLNYLGIFSIWAFVSSRNSSVSLTTCSTRTALAAKDPKNAKKAALLACVLMTMGLLFGLCLLGLLPDKALILRLNILMQVKKQVTLLPILRGKVHACWYGGSTYRGYVRCDMFPMDSGLNRNSHL